MKRITQKELRGVCGGKFLQIDLSIGNLPEFGDFIYQKDVDLTIYTYVSKLTEKTYYYPVFDGTVKIGSAAEPKSIPVKTGILVPYANKILQYFFTITP